MAEHMIFPKDFISYLRRGWIDITNFESGDTLIRGQHLSRSKLSLKVIGALFVLTFTAVIGTTSANAANVTINCPGGGNYTLDTATGIATSGTSACTGALHLDPRVTSIAYAAFQGSGLTSLTLSDTLTSIGDFAFNGQPLTSLTLNSAITSIGDSAFDGAHLTSLTLNSGLTSISDNAFYSSPLTSLTLNSALTSIGSRAFLHAHLTSLTLNSSLTYIGEFAFNDSPLTSLTLNSGLTSIELGTFTSSLLTTLTLNSAITSIGEGAFYSAPLTSLNLNSSLQSIGNDAFRSAQLETLTLNSAISTIGNYAFASSPLTSLNLNSALTSIGVGAFQSAAPIFTLSRTSENVVPGAPITSYSISSIGGAIESFTVSPAIENGLSFDTSTGLISGIPTLAASAKVYTITGTNSIGTSTRTYTITVAPIVVAAAQLESPAAAAAEAAAKREAEKLAARAEISNMFKNSENVTLDAFRRAEISGITAKNIDEVQSEILSLNEESRGDIQQIIKVARKYEIVGMIASTQVATVPAYLFVEIGLIPVDSKNKTSLVYAIREIPAEERGNFLEIKAAIEIATAKIQARKDRLAALISRHRL